MTKKRAAKKSTKPKSSPPGIVPGLLAPRVVPLSELVHDPRNARTHDERNLAAIEGSLRRFGQHRSFVAHARADGKLVVRIGNGMLEAMRRLGWTEAAVVVVEEGEAEAVARAIADNRAGELAIWDDRVLAELLRDLPKDVLPATGFDAADLDAMLRSLEAEKGEPVDAETAWRGMPEFAQDDLTPHRTLHVHFASDADVEVFAKLVRQSVTDKTRFLWFPPAPIGRMTDKRFEDEASARGA
jgi:hypothetical protein